MSVMSTAPARGMPARGLIQVERHAFEPDIPGHDALLAEALAMAPRLLSAQDRRDLETTLAFGDVVIPHVAVQTKAWSSPDDMVLALADRIARAVAEHVRREGLPAKIRAAAEALRKKTDGFMGRLKRFFARPQGFGLSEDERALAVVSGQEMRAVIEGNLDPSSDQGRITIDRVQRLDEAVQGYARAHGIHFENFQIHHGRVVMALGGAIPSVNPNTADFTKLSYGHSEREREAIRHEVVHVVHTTQARVTAMRQVCAKWGVQSVAQLPVEGLAEVQLRVNQFESGSNYPRLEVLATGIGGAGGKKSLSEREYRARLLQGSKAVEEAFQRDDLAFDTQAGIRDRITAQFGARVGESTLQGLGNLLGLFVGWGATSAGLALGPWVLAPAILWNVLRQPEVRALIGKGLDKVS
ncbi:MAG: hypothetical protein M9894_39075 [Planctomycetes bacterium]|nr:hypothetical protein [Planctomycetota bacterium]